jgi:phytoene dehydrogenase-like protein
MNRVIGKIDPSDKHVYIWGAGFSGLVLGYYLKSEGYKVTIYEKTNKIG